MSEPIKLLLQGSVAALALFCLCCIALILLLSEAGIFALFVATFVVATATGCGAALLAMDFLYPKTMAVPGLVGLLWLVLPASLASVLLFDLGIEGFMLRLLQRRGTGGTGIELLETIAGGLVTTVSLVVAARLLPEVRLSAGAALVAGLISAFLRYYIGLYLRDIAPGGEPD